MSTSIGPQGVTSRVLIDTGALLALASPRDQYHSRAVELGRRFLAGGGRWVGTTLVLAEFHGHLLHRLGGERARALLTQLLQDPVYEWQDASIDLVRGAVGSWLDRYRDQRFSLTDAVSFELMRRERLAVAFAFDQDFVTAGFELLA
jgi:uncharacterized protein